MCKSKVLEQGFLDKNIKTLVSNNRKKYEPLFNLALEVNKLCYDSYELLIGKRISGQQQYIIATFGEIHKSYQSAIILFERGLEYDGKIILRSILEGIYHIKAVENDENNLRKVFLGNDYELKKLYNVVMNRPYMRHLKDKITKFNITKGERVSTEKWAEYAGMSDDYDYAYRLTSPYVHRGLSTIFDNMKNSEEISHGEKFLIFDTKCDNLEFDLIILIRYMVESLIIYANMISLLKTKEEAEKLLNKVEKYELKLNWENFK